MDLTKYLNTNEKGIEILTWYVRDQLYGLLLEDCREVIKNVEILPIPHSKSYLAGIHNLRGEIITVIDIGVKLGYPQQSLSNKEAIIRLKKNSKLSLLADSVNDILEISKSQLESPPRNLNAQERKCINFVVKVDNTIILILNLEGITERE